MRVFCSILALFLFLYTCPVQGIHKTEHTVENCCKANPELPEHINETNALQLADFCFLKVRSGYFYPTSNNFRSFYPSGPIWSLEWDCRIQTHLYSWVSAGYFHKRGQTNLHRPTKLTLAPLSAGIMWLYNAYQWLQPYFGGGAQFLYARELTASPDLIHSVHNWDFGVQLKSGILIQLFDHFSIDFYADYFCKCARIYAPSHHSVNIENPNMNYFNFGGALGVVF